MNAFFDDDAVRLRWAFECRFGEFFGNSGAGACPEPAQTPALFYWDMREALAALSQLCCFAERDQTQLPKALERCTAIWRRLTPAESMLLDFAALHGRDSEPMVFGGVFFPSWHEAAYRFLGRHVRPLANGGGTNSWAWEMNTPTLPNDFPRGETVQYEIGRLIEGCLFEGRALVGYIIQDARKSPAALRRCIASLWPIYQFMKREDADELWAAMKLHGGYIPERPNTEFWCERVSCWDLAAAENWANPPKPPGDLVSVKDIAALVHRPKRRITSRHIEEWGKPAVKCVGRSPSQWSYAAIRNTLSLQFLDATLPASLPVRPAKRRWLGFKRTFRRG